ncbi:MAG TPA: IS1595 family transposase [Candidatus Angelobacter sp.]|nr:IS1595 family transposase [Candidatus Angelobacter sp.]
MAQPKTLQQAIQYYGNPDNCLNHLVAQRWPSGVECPTCGSKDVRFIATRRIWECKTKHPKKQFSVKVGTIFEDSPIGLDKWLTAAWMIANCKNGVSSYEIHRALGVTQKTAWFMLHRIRLAMQDENGGKLKGHVEADETFIGGKARFMHADRRVKNSVNPFYNKTIVMGVLERDGKVRTQVIEDRDRKTLHAMVSDNVEFGSYLSTDDCQGYWGLYKNYVHEIIDHAETYVSGKVHTNGIENFWSCLKRGLKGTYISVEPFHLFRYLDEQMFRYNNRATKKQSISDADRFTMLTANLVGKRITYQQLIGKGEEAQAN